MYKLLLSSYITFLFISPSQAYQKFDGCIYDEQTNLTWEAKTTDNSLHDAKWTYSWFEKGKGWTNLGKCLGNIGCDTSSYTIKVNNEKLCGLSDWRLPTVKEAETLIKCPKGRSDDWTKGNPCIGWGWDISTPFIDPIFENTGKSYYWTSEVYPVISTYSWYIYPYMGATNRTFQSEARSIRLVNSGKPKSEVILPIEQPKPIIFPSSSSNIKSIILKLNYTSETEGTFKFQEQ